MLPFVNAELARGLPCVTVRATHFALRNLPLDRRPWASAVDQVRDVPELVTKVVEVQHDRIGLPAVGARMRIEVLTDSQPVFGGHLFTSDPDAIYHRVTILEVPAMLVIGRARATQRVANASVN